MALSSLQALLSSNVMNTAILSHIQKNPETIKNLNPLILEHIKLIYKYRECSDEPFNLSKIFRQTNHSLQMVHPSPRESLTHILTDLIEITKKSDTVLSELIEKICHGKYKQTTRCGICRNDVIDYLDFLVVDLPVSGLLSGTKPQPIPTLKKGKTKGKEDPNLDLSDCFKQFSRFKMSGKEEKWTCPVCNIEDKSFKKIEIAVIPSVIILSFDRFKGADVDLTPIQLHPQIMLEDKKMELIATINHRIGKNEMDDIESINHRYTTCVNHDDIWYKIDGTSTESYLWPTDSGVLNNPSICVAIYQEQYTLKNV